MNLRNGHGGRLLAVIAALLACGCRAEGSAPDPAKAAAQAEAPGSAGKPAEGDKAAALAGRTFRVPAGQVNGTDLNRVLSAAAKAEDLPGGAEEVGPDGRPIQAAPSPEAAARAAEAERVKADIRARLTDMYARMSGQKVEIVSIEEVSGLYQVAFTVGGDKTRPPSMAHVTLDGKLLFEDGSDLPKRHQAVVADHAFAQCLKLKGLRVVGDMADKDTQEQIKEIGSFAGLILVDCRLAPENCKKLGLKLPAILHGEDSFTGPRPRAFLETLTGCK